MLNRNAITGCFLFMTSGLFLLGSSMPLTAAEIQFLDAIDAEDISYPQFCELMDQQEGSRLNDKEPFCNEGNISRYDGLPFVKSMAQLFGQHGAILDGNTTNEGTSGDGLALLEVGPRHFGFSLYTTLDAQKVCKNSQKLTSCDEIHKFIEEELQRNFFFIVSKKTNQYYYFINARDETSGETVPENCILIGEFTILDSSLHAISSRIFREYVRKYGKPNHLNAQKDIVVVNAWKAKPGKYLYLTYLKVGEDLMHNFSGLTEFSVDKIYAGHIYARRLSLVKQQVVEKVKAMKKGQEAAQKKLIDEAIK